MFNISLPGKEQAKNIIWTIVYSFVSSMLGVFVLAGGIQSTWEATVQLLIASTIAGINAALYTLKITLFDEKK